MSFKAPLLVVLLLLAPALAVAQTDTSGSTDTSASADVNYSSTFAYQRQGIFGCNLNGSYAMSVGALSATGGVFVPVNDAAVTLNTGYLVYKECVLRGIVDRMREDATAALQKQIIIAYERGRNGQPLFSQSIPLESRAVSDKAILGYLQSGQLNTLNPALQGAVSRAIAQGYMAARNKPNSAYACGYAGNLNTVYSGNSDRGTWAGLSAIATPGCDPIYAYNLANEQALGFAAYAVNNNLTQLQWYNGNYPVMGTDADGNPIVLTPGSIVGSNVLQALQTGFVQLQNANDIDQMVGALFAGITTQVVADSRGLIGLTQPTGSQPSYLDQVVKEASAGLRNSATNAALQILVAAKQVETAFLAAMNAIAQILTNAIANLRAKENACWTLIIQKVCTAAPAKDNTCSASDGTTLKVATSTAYSQAVINANIAPLANSTANNINTSTKALSLINQLIAGITNTTSLNAQRVALQQLDNLVAQHALHNQYDLQNAQQTQQNIGASMDTLISDTIKVWADSTDATTGWCNINNPAVLDMWKQKWKK